jgi:hypothetical protein
LEIVIALVERFSGLRKVAEVFLDHVSHKLIDNSCSTLRSEVLEFLFCLGGKVYFHPLSKIGETALPGNGLCLGCMRSMRLTMPSPSPGRPRSPILGLLCFGTLKTFLMSLRLKPSDSGYKFLKAKEYRKSRVTSTNLLRFLGRVNVNQLSTMRGNRQAVPTREVLSSQRVPCALAPRGCGTQTDL